MLEPKTFEQFVFITKNNTKFLSESKLNHIDENSIFSFLINNFVNNKYHDISVVSTPYSGGFHSDTTGGKFKNLTINDKRRNKLLSVILKHSPSFVREQKNLYKLLKSLGYLELMRILKKYPSNQINKRELMFYKYLSNKVDIRVPKFYFGIINSKTEESWLILEDLSEWEKIKPMDKRWTKLRMNIVLKKMARFHSTFWGKSLNKFDWIGRWWTNNKSDYMAEDVALFGLEICRKMYPNILTKDIYKKLSEAISKRDLINNIFLQQKQTLIHWDFNPNNILFNKLNSNKEDFILLDWQLASIGIPHLDVAQFIISNMGVENEDNAIKLINNYIYFLEKYTNETFDLEEFMKIFDLAVLDHFFRVCAPVLINGNKESLTEWSNCLGWINKRSLARLN